MNQTPATTAQTPPFEEISSLAYQLWQEASCPPGQDIDFWLQAEERLTKQRGATQGAAAKAPSNHKTAVQNTARPNGKGAAKRQPNVPKTPFKTR